MVVAASWPWQRRQIAPAALPKAANSGTSAHGRDRNSKRRRKSLGVVGKAPSGGKSGSEVPETGRRREICAGARRKALGQEPLELRRRRKTSGKGPLASQRRRKAPGKGPSGSRRRTKAPGKGPLAPRHCRKASGQRPTGVLPSAIASGPRRRRCVAESRRAINGVSGRRSAGIPV